MVTTYYMVTIYCLNNIILLSFLLENDLFKNIVAVFGAIILVFGLKKYGSSLKDINTPKFSQFFLLIRYPFIYIGTFDRNYYHGNLKTFLVILFILGLLYDLGCIVKMLSECKE